MTRLLSEWGGLSLTILCLGVGCAQTTVPVAPKEPRGPVEAEALVDRAVATTGDLITYRVRVDSDPSFEIDFPEAGAEIAGFRIVDVGREVPVEEGGRVWEERWYQLRADLVGSYVLPPIEVGYRPVPIADEQDAAWQTLTTSEIFVEVESVLPTNGEASDIRGLKPLREVRPPVPWLLIGSIAALVALVIVGLYWYLRRRARMKVLQPPVPAHELAFAALNRLRETDFEDPESVRSFYFQISEVLRAYVEGRFLLNATDLTTEEILANAAALEELQADQDRALADFLLGTDQVKFAHREPTRADIEGTYELALNFVEATRPVLEDSDVELAA